MSRAPDNDAADDSPPAQEPVGRVEFDSRGNSVWRWARDVVVESTSVLLKKLENKDLALEPTQKVPVVRGAEPPPKGAKPSAANRKAPDEPKSAPRHPALQRARPRDSGGGFDPYNSR